MNKINQLACNLLQILLLGILFFGEDLSKEDKLVCLAFFVIFGIWANTYEILTKLESIQQERK